MHAEVSSMDTVHAILSIKMKSLGPFADRHTRKGRDVMPDIMTFTACHTSVEAIFPK